MCTWSVVHEMHTALGTTRTGKERTAIKNKEQTELNDKRGETVPIITTSNQVLLGDRSIAMGLGTDYPPPNRRINGDLCVMCLSKEARSSYTCGLLVSNTHAYRHAHYQDKNSEPEN
jgi:hypothetical protein